MDSRPFSDRLYDRMHSLETFLVAGFDPVFDDLPAFIINSASGKSLSLDERVYLALNHFYSIALDAIGPKVAAVKPNLAFFEQYGVAGMRAFQSIAKDARSRGILVIADAKRGDIGSTAKAYSNAYLGKARAFGEQVTNFEADALTVNPYLGFDTLEVFLEDCERFGKGMFVLVKTSNVGSGDLQDFGSKKTETVSTRVASWIREKAPKLQGACGLSGLGAVIGATYPNELASLRKTMPESIFLIPGMGAQGGKASDTVAGFTTTYTSGNLTGAIVNASRGIFGSLPASVTNETSLALELSRRVDAFNHDIKTALNGEAKQ